MGFPVIDNVQNYLFDIEKEGLQYFSYPSAVYYGSGWYLKSIIVSAVSTDSNATYASFYLLRTKNGNQYPENNAGNIDLKAGATIDIPINALLSQVETIKVQRSDANANIALKVIYNMTKICGDTEFGRGKVWLHIGDSVANFDGYVSRINGHMISQTKDYFNYNGSDYRSIYVSKSGYSSTQIVNDINAFMYRFRRADIITCAFGINDSGGGTSDAQWNLNLQSVVDWRDSCYKNAKLIFISPNPIANEPGHSFERCLELNAITADFVDQSKNTYYIDISDAFTDRTPNGTYLSDYVHPTQAGHDACAAKLIERMAGLIL